MPDVPIEASVRAEVLQLNQQLLDSISAGDWKTYSELCDPNLTCFEPETHGRLVAGMGFHKFFFDLGAPSQPRTTTMVSPQIWVLGLDAVVVAYVRMVQSVGGDEHPVISATEETRVWQRVDGRWRHVHFHRSLAGG